MCSSDLLEMGGVAPAAGAADLVCNEAAITNTCEVTNKFMYRSSKWVTLNATAYNNEHAKFLDSSGLMLSDMDPILTDVSWTTNLGRTLGGGTTTSDCTTFTAPSGYQISGFFGRSGTGVDKLGVFYSKVS